MLVSALQSLPYNVKAKIGYDGVFDALLSAQMNGNNVELAQAALDKARAGVEAALEAKGLDAGTKQALMDIFVNIDSMQRVGDNGNSNTILRDTLISNGYKILETKTAETANIEWANRGYEKPPIKPGTEVIIVEAGDNQYVRLYSEENGNMAGRWIMRKSDIEGLSLSEIADLYSIPNMPSHICDVNLPSNLLLEVSEANPLDNIGDGGGIQLDMMNTKPKPSWFTNPRELE